MGMLAPQKRGGSTVWGEDTELKPKIEGIPQASARFVFGDRHIGAGDDAVLNMRMLSQ